MEKYTPGILLVHPNNQVVSNRHLDVFVDDTSLGVTKEAMKRHKTKNGSPVELNTNVRDQIQTNMSFYNSMLKLIGGALAWKKCTAYILQFYWNNGIKFLHQTKEMYPSLEIPDIFTNSIYNILLANPTEAFRMLGAFVDPDGNTEDQVKILVKKSQNFHNHI